MQYYLILREIFRKYNINQKYLLFQIICLTNKQKYLQKAAKYGINFIIKYLISEEDLNFYDALYAATKTGQLEIFKYLHEKKWI